MSDILTEEKPTQSFTIATRMHIPGAVLNQLDRYSEDDRKLIAPQYEWTYADSEVVNKETASFLAKPTCNDCRGKGWNEVSRVPVGNAFYDYIQMCFCSRKNGAKLNV